MSCFATHGAPERGALRPLLTGSQAPTHRQRVQVTFKVAKRGDTRSAKGAIPALVAQGKHLLSRFRSDVRRRGLELLLHRPRWLEAPPV